MTFMRHGEYVARITYAEEIDSFFGEVIHAKDIITFYGRSVEELKREVATSIEVHLEGCRAKGVEPGRRYSGKFNVRLSPVEHAQIAAAAAVTARAWMPGLRRRWPKRPSARWQSSRSRSSIRAA